MQVKAQKLSPTHYRLDVAADAETLQTAKDAVVRRLGKNVKLPGFRPGKVPQALVEKSLDASSLNAEFLDEAMSRAYSAAVTSEKLRPVSQPKVELKKFVPFTTLEFSAEFDVVGEIKLGDYKQLKVKRPEVSVPESDIDEVIANMQQRLAERQLVDRAAKDGDEVVFDFDGVDSKGQAIDGASGKDYPLILGSKAFIPGFEDEMIGLKAGDDKTFKITFPKSYAAKSLQNARVSFSVKVHKVQEVVTPQVNDDFAQKVSEGHVKTAAQLKTDIREQLMAEKQRQADSEHEAAVVKALIDKSSIELPDSLVEQQADQVLAELKQNLTYRGLTIEEYLQQVGIKADEHRTKELLPEAKRRLSGGYLLAEVADKEAITVTPEELETRVVALKQQYAGDDEMQKQLESEAGMRDIAARMLTERTIAKLLTYV